MSLLETKREMLSAKQSGDDGVDEGNPWARKSGVRLQAEGLARLQWECAGRFEEQIRMLQLKEGGQGW